jgi:hypothetical protein
MSLELDQLANGLTPDHDLFFAERPEDPEMRESTSIWLFEENGEFAMPRVGIEGIASSWDQRPYQANFAFPGGRILDASGTEPGPSPFGPDGRPTVFGAGPLTFRCLDPFRRWALRYEGEAVDGTVDQQIHRKLDPKNKVPVRIEVELAMETPAWVEDNSPEKLAEMSEAQRSEAQNMGLGWRLEHLFRGQGELKLDGTSRSFRCVGSRIKRQSVRPLVTFRGHCWQSALFPDGRGFGFITFPPDDRGEALNQGYVYQDGKMHPARATKIPWLRRLADEGDDVTFELESSLGTTRIEASTLLTTYRIMTAADGLPFDFNLHQGGARYTWDGMASYGMIERSCKADQLTA